MGVYSAIYRGEWGCTVLFIGGGADDRGERGCPVLFIGMSGWRVEGSRAERGVEKKRE